MTLERRTPLKRTGFLARSQLKPGPPKVPSERRNNGTAAPKRQMDWSDETRVELDLRSGGKCELCGRRVKLDPHHRKLRRHGDHRAANAISCCRRCHDWIHANVLASYCLGWLVEGHRDPAEVSWGPLPGVNGLVGGCLPNPTDDLQETAPWPRPFPAASQSASTTSACSASAS